MISIAGQKGRITVATNMAGRGTDIMLGEGVAELGGLYVLVQKKMNHAGLTTNYAVVQVDKVIQDVLSSLSLLKMILFAVLPRKIRKS